MKVNESAIRMPPPHGFIIHWSLMFEPLRQPVAGADDRKYLEWNLRVLYAVSLMATAEAGYGPPSNTGSSATDSPGTFTARTCSRPLTDVLKVLILPARDDMEPAAGLTLREQQLAWAEELPHSTSREGLQLLTRKVGKERGLFENEGQISARRGHRKILQERLWSLPNARSRDFIDL